jgi:hypothetical protein
MMVSNIPLSRIMAMVFTLSVMPMLSQIVYVILYLNLSVVPDVPITVGLILGAIVVQILDFNREYGRVLV